MLKRSIVLILTIIIAITTASCSVGIDNQATAGDAPLKVTFMDVGQGDAILVQCGGSTMLVDAGTTDACEEVLGQLERSKVEKIDVLVGTHPHEDHIGSLDKVIYSYDIGCIYMPKVTSNTKSFKDVVTAIKSKGLSIITPEAGSSFSLGEAECTILAPNSKNYEELNNYSIVIRMVYKNTSYLFTGDAETFSEKEMLDKGYELSADVLKVGHHCSSSSTSKEFLDAVKPKYAVIMCGKNNDYKHPHRVTINRLKKADIPVYRTDECGTVVCVSDGNNISFNVEPGSYKSGTGTK